MDLGPWCPLCGIHRVQIVTQLCPVCEDDKNRRPPALGDVETPARPQLSPGGSS